MALALVRNSSTGPFDRFAEGIRGLDDSKLEFTGEQFIPGAGVEICYEHYHRYAFAASLIKPTDRVLDLGCGVGYGSLWLAGFADEVYALDRDPRCIDSLREVASKLQFNNVHPIRADIADLLSPSVLKAHSIDVVVCHELIEHLDSQQQQSLISWIGRGDGPFKASTALFISTPEKDEYERTRAEHNPFHLHELSREAFTGLLSGSFKHVHLMWQGRAEANCLYPLMPTDSGDAFTGNSLITYLDWLNRETLVAKFSTTPHGSGVYLYAVASQEAMIVPRESLLVDLSSRAIDERLAIAAHELRQKDSQLDHLTRERRSNQESVELHNMTQSQQRTIGLQSQKIKHLVADLERMGAENANECRRADRLAERVTQLTEELSALRPWVDLARERLGPDLESARLQADVLWSYVAAMGSPGHRLVTWLGKVVGRTFVGRAVRKILNVIMVLRQA